MRRLVVAKCGLALVAAALLLPLGCGYNQQGSDKNKLDAGYRWNSLYREDVQTVAVPIFTNRTFSQGLEFRLTEAVIKQMELHAPYKVVAKERADTILEGQIVEISQRTMSKDYRTNLPREQELTLVVSITWKDLRNGRILAQRTRLQQTGLYVENVGEGRFVGEQQAIERFGLSIVQELQADW
jgi:hypothetical protein